MRTYTSSRVLGGATGERERIGALIARQPATVTVQRLSGGGITAPKTWTTVATFTGRLDEGRALPLVATDGFQLVPTGGLLTVLVTNDAVDGVSGNPVDLRRGDHVTIAGVTAEVTALVTFTAHLEATLATLA